VKWNFRRLNRGDFPMTPLRFLLVLAVTALASALRAQIADLPYGAPIPLAEAKRFLAAAQVEAAKNKWNVAIAIVDTGGHLVAFERMDTTQFGSVEVAQEKARTAVAFRRPSKAFQDNVAAGGEGLRTLRLTGAIPIDGGLPLVVGGKIVGAIGVSGVTSAQDGQIAAAAVAALK
jgi:glc operon protein GlcG